MRPWKSIFVSLASRRPTHSSDQEPSVTHPTRLPRSLDLSRGRRRETPIFSDTPLITKITCLNDHLNAPCMFWWLGSDHSPHTPTPKCRGLLLSKRARKDACTYSLYLLVPERLGRHLSNPSTSVNAELHFQSPVTVLGCNLIYSIMATKICGAFNLNSVKSFTVTGLS